MSYKSMLQAWPIIAAGATALLAWGTLAADVSRMKEQAAAYSADRELLIELRTQQRYMQNDVEEIKRHVRELAREQRNH